MNPFKASKVEGMPTVKNAIDGYPRLGSGQQQPSSSDQQQQPRSDQQQPLSSDQQQQSSGQQKPQSSGQQQPPKSGQEQPPISGQEQPPNAGQQQPPSSSKQQPRSSGQQKPPSSDQQGPQSSGQQQESSQTPTKSGSSKESSQAKSDWDKWRLGVLIEYRKLEQSVRLKSGQEVDEFIIKSTFNEEPISSSKISPVLSFNNGKCHIVDMGDVAVTSGPYNGLTLTLFLDRDEYITKLVKGYGATIVIHEPGTFPVPGEEGYILNPGYQTNIAIRTKVIHRLGHPHGDCVESSNFNTKYGFNYTTPVCFTICVKEAIEKACNCTPYLSPEKINDANSVLNVCDVRDLCSYTTRKEISKEPARCNCNSRCQESIYSLTFSSRQWPQITYLEDNVLADACKKGIASLYNICTENGDLKQNITPENYKDFAEHFLNINIYYDSLVYEEIVESLLYSTIGFLSDIGGSMGLFLGASLMTYLELLHLIAELVVYAYARCTNRRTKVSPIGPLKKESIVSVYETKQEKNFPISEYSA